MCTLLCVSCTSVKIIEASEQNIITFETNNNIFLPWCVFLLTSLEVSLCIAWSQMIVRKRMIKKYIKKWVIHRCLGLLKEKQQDSVSLDSTPRSQDLAIIESLWKRLKHKTEKLIIEGD